MNYENYEWFLFITWDLHIDFWIKHAHDEVMWLWCSITLSIYKSKYAVCKWTLCVSGSVTTYETDGEEDDVPDTPEPPPPYPPHGTGRKPG